VKKIVKIGPVDPEILRIKEIIKKDINASKSGLYMPVAVTE